MKGLIDALFIGNLEPRDLEYEKKAFDDPNRLRLVNLALDRPLEAANLLMSFHEKASGSLSGLLATAMADILEVKPGQPPQFGAGSLDFPDAVPRAYRASLGRLAAELSRANAAVKAALATLSPDERRMLIECLPQWACPEFSYDFVRREPAARESLLATLARVDLNAILTAGVRLTAAAQEESEVLAKLASANPFDGILRFAVDGMLVVLAGTGDDLHVERGALLTVDLGGNDRYTGRHGAGPGYASLLIDVSGDDLYDVPDLSVGAAVAGIGVALDLGGNDVFRGRSLCFGAALAGVGVFSKTGGDDDYRSSAMAQGFAWYGVGICRDTAGRDRYEASLNAQGSAGPRGVGWLADLAGNDTYRAGGAAVHSPLFDTVHYSKSQGFGTGIREDTGGIGGGVGLLSDLGGDDSYLGETFCQAASYWFAVGSLYDKSGHDTYRAYHYGQSSAMHFCGAFLFDLAGDDAYSVSFGAAHGIGHDYGVAFFLDRAGDDIYSARDSRPGIGNANGLGIFLESAGDDRYAGPPGAGNPARGAGSLGVFADLGGMDRYAEGLQDAWGRVGPEWGIALDFEPSVVMGGGDPAPPRPKPAPNSKPMPPEAELEALYAKATQWAVGTAQQEAAEATHRLIEIGLPALDWMIAKKLRSASRLEQRAFVDVVWALEEAGRARVSARVASPDDAEARVALLICIDAGIREAAPHIPRALGRPALTRTAARAAGVIGAREAVDALMAICASQDRLAAMHAMVSLGQIADARAIGTAVALIPSSELPIRRAALALAAKFPDEALQSGKLLMRDPVERKSRLGVELLGLAGTPECLAAAGEALSDERHGMRIQALIALDGRCPTEFRRRFLELRDDRNSLVRAVARRLDVGR